MLVKTAAAILIASLTAAHAQPSVPGSGVTATPAWSRVTQPGADTAAVYVTLKAPVQDKLIAAATPEAKKAEIQNTTVENNVVVMHQLPAGLGLPPGQPVPLQPGGYQITLTGLTKPLKLNDTFPLRLTFEISQPIDLVARVAAIGVSNPPAAH